MGNGIAYAYWTAPGTGIVELKADWARDTPPPIRCESTGKPPALLRRASKYVFAARSGYFCENGWITFVVNPSAYPQFDWQNGAVYLASDFNGWAHAIGSLAWQMEPSQVSEFKNRRLFQVNLRRAECLSDGAVQFKFVTEKREWLEAPASAPNVVTLASGARNLEFDPARTGAHLFSFTIPEHSGFGDIHRLLWSDEVGSEPTPIVLGDFFNETVSSLCLGARCEESQTLFRLFAPRARSATVKIYDNLEGVGARSLSMTKADPYTWEAWWPENLHGTYYHFQVEGDLRQPNSVLDSEFPI